MQKNQNRNKIGILGDSLVFTLHLISSLALGCTQSATVEIYGGIFINYNPATGDNTGEADDTFVAPGYKSVETTYNGQQAWQVIPE